MKSLWLVLVALLAVTMFHTANAQTKESAPQEPPFVEENEFDLPATPLNSATPAQAQDPLKAESDDAASIENEILQSGGEPMAPPPTEKNSTVDLNKNVPEAGSQSDDLLLEDNAPVIAAPSNEIPSSEIPMEEPPVPVKAAAPVYSNDVVAKSAAGGVRYIHHPQAAVGLIRIEKDGTYVYRTNDKGEVKTTGAFRFGMMDAPIIYSSDGTSFAKMYSGPQVPLLMFDYEWQPFKMSQNLKVQAGFDLMLANGNGRFAKSGPGGSNPTQGEAAKEEYTFVAIPLNAGLAYRFQYMDRQILAPYILGGGSYIPVVEFRDDGKSTNLVGTAAAYGGGGLLLNVGAMDRETSFTLRSEYGVTNLWVSLEYRYLKSFSEDVDFSSNVISAGLTLDY